MPVVVVANATGVPLRIALLLDRIPIYYDDCAPFTLQARRAEDSDPFAGEARTRGAAAAETVLAGAGFVLASSLIRIGLGGPGQQLATRAWTAATERAAAYAAPVRGVVLSASAMVGFDATRMVVKDVDGQVQLAR